MVEAAFKLEASDPKFTLNVFSAPSRLTFTSTVSSMEHSRTATIKSLADEIFLPLNETMMSPTSMPASSAPEPALTAETYAPSETARP